MAHLASVQGADNKRNQINVGNSAHGVKGLDGELPLELSVPRQMVGEGNRLWDTREESCLTGAQSTVHFCPPVGFPLVFPVTVALPWVCTRCLPSLLF